MNCWVKNYEGSITIESWEGNILEEKFGINVET